MVSSSAGRSATRRARMFGRSGISSKRNFGAVRRRYGGRGTRAYPFSSVHTTPLRNRSAIELPHPRGRFTRQDPPDDAVVVAAYDFPSAEPVGGNALAGERNSKILGARLRIRGLRRGLRKRREGRQEQDRSDHVAVSYGASAAQTVALYASGSEPVPWGPGCRSVIVSVASSYEMRPDSRKTVPPPCTLVCVKEPTISQRLGESAVMKTVYESRSIQVLSLVEIVTVRST